MWSSGHQYRIVRTAKPCGISKICHSSNILSCFIGKYQNICRFNVSVDDACLELVIGLRLEYVL